MISFTKLMKQVIFERMSFRQLLGGSESGRIHRGKHDVRSRPMRVTTMDGNEAWTFRYKSNPSTTGNPWHGYVQFFKEDVNAKDNAMNLDCMVDCDCPDYRYRYAYNNAHADAGRIGRSSDWKYGNDNNGQKWKPRSQGGVGDYGVGLCKHLISLTEFMRDVIEPNAPEPDDELPPPKVIKKPKIEPPVSMKTPTPVAPKPEDSYSDSRTGSDTLQEQQGSKMYERINNFVKTHSEFDVYYEEEST